MAVQNFYTDHVNAMARELTMAIILIAKDGREDVYYRTRVLAICCLTIAAKMRRKSFSLDQFLKGRFADDISHQLVPQMELRILKGLQRFYYYFHFIKTYGCFKHRGINEVIVQSQGVTWFPQFNPFHIALSSFLAATFKVYPKEFDKPRKPDEVIHCLNELISMSGNINIVVLPVRIGSSSSEPRSQSAPAILYSPEGGSDPIPIPQRRPSSRPTEARSAPATPLGPGEVGPGSESSKQQEQAKGEAEVTETSTSGGNAAPPEASASGGDAATPEIDQSEQQRLAKGEAGVTEASTSGGDAEPPEASASGGDAATPEIDQSEQQRQAKGEAEVTEASTSGGDAAQPEASASGGDAATPEIDQSEQQRLAKGKAVASEDEQSEQLRQAKGKAVMDDDTDTSFDAESDVEDELKRLLDGPKLDVSAMGPYFDEAVALGKLQEQLRQLLKMPTGTHPQPHLGTLILILLLLLRPTAENATQDPAPAPARDPNPDSPPPPVPPPSENDPPGPAPSPAHRNPDSPPPHPAQKCACGCKIL